MERPGRLVWICRGLARTASKERGTGDAACCERLTASQSAHCSCSAADGGSCLVSGFICNLNLAVISLQTQTLVSGSETLPLLPPVLLNFCSRNATVTGISPAVSGGYLPQWRLLSRRSGAEMSGRQVTHRHRLRAPHTPVGATVTYPHLLYIPRATGPESVTRNSPPRLGDRRTRARCAPSVLHEYQSCSVE
jgi:hypothetical protein